MKRTKDGAELDAPTGKRRMTQRVIQISGGEALPPGIIAQYRNQKLCDVQLIVGCSTIGAHRVVLAGSSAYMSARFESGMADSGDAVSLHDLDFDIFQRVIEWQYTGACEIGEDQLQDLLATAMRLQVATLTAACAEQLAARVSLENCIGALALADQCALPQLKAVALKLATCHFDTLAAQEDFSLLPASCLEELLSRDHLGVSHEDVACQAVLDWLLKQKVLPSAAVVFGLLRRLRLAWTSLECLAKFRDNELVRSHPQGLALVFQGYEQKAVKFGSAGADEMESHTGSCLPRTGYDPEIIREHDPRRIRSNALSICLAMTGSADVSSVAGLAMAAEVLNRERTPAFLNQHLHINVMMREILINWLWEVGAHYDMMRDTIHVAVNFLDRYLTHHKDVLRANLQAVGLASLVVATRCEESNGFPLKDAEDISDNTYSEEVLKQFVDELLKLVGLSPAVMTSRSILAFLHTYTRRIGIDAPAETCALYICDSVLVFADTLEFPLEVIAASAIEVARNSLGAAAIDWATMPWAPPSYTCMEALTRMCNQNRSPLYTGESRQASKEYYEKDERYNVSALTICVPARNTSAEPSFSGGERVAVPSGDVSWRSSYWRF
jgi:hypothetical protein